MERATTILIALFTALAVVFTSFAGCGEIALDEQHPQNNVSPPTSFTTYQTSHELNGQILFKGDPLSNVRVMVLQTPNETEDVDYEFEPIMEASTGMDGIFNLTIPASGTYYVVAGKQVEDGSYIMGHDMLEISVDNQDSKWFNLGTFDMSYVHTDNLEDYDTMTQELGTGRGCLAVGCETKYWAWLRWMCCGVDLCVIGMEGCVPYGRDNRPEDQRY